MRFQSNIIELPGHDGSIRAEDVREIRVMDTHPDHLDNPMFRPRVNITTKHSTRTVYFDDITAAGDYAAELHRWVYKFDRPSPESLREVLRFFSVEVLQEEINRRTGK